MGAGRQLVLSALLLLLLLTQRVQAGSGEALTRQWWEGRGRRHTTRDVHMRQRRPHEGAALTDPLRQLPSLFAPSRTGSQAEDGERQVESPVRLR